MSLDGESEGLELIEDDTEQRSRKRQKTLSKVCETCRLKKSKCDNAQPKCSTCRRKGVSCTYREKGQPGLRPGYGKAMENRMERLEESIENMSRSMQTFLNQANPSMVSTSFASEQVLPSEPVENQDNPTTMVNGSADAPGLWETPPPMMPDEVTADISGPIQQSPLDVRTSISPGQPSMQTLNELAETYFDRVYPWCPLFHKATFIDTLFSPEREILLHGLVVSCLRFHNLQDYEDYERCMRHSREQILLTAMGSCTLISTQALALLAVDALGRGTGPQAWNTMSLLATAARHLGIATNPALSNAVTESNTPLVRNDDDDSTMFPSRVEQEERVRLFWVICTLDRFSSVAHGVPGGIPSTTIRMSYPRSDAHWDDDAESLTFDGASRLKDFKASESLDLWHHFVDLMSIADRCNQLLIQPANLFVAAQCQQWQNSFRTLDNGSTNWNESLPGSIRQQPQNFDPMWYLLHANFHLIRVRMYTVAAFPSTTSPHVRPSTSARTRCRSAVKEISSLARSLEPHQLERIGPMFAFVLWVATRSLIILWTTAHDTYENMIGDMEPLLSSLRQLGRHWQSATRYSDLIQLVLDSKDSPGGQSHLDVFNDTRRTAWGLEKCLGGLAQRRNADIQPTAFDFLDMPFLDAGDAGNQWMGGFRLDGDGELF